MSEISSYLVLIIITAIALSITTGYNFSNFTVPFNYYSDAIFSAVFTKNIVDTGWVNHSDLIGAPYGSDMYDFPTTDTLHFVILKGIGFVIKDPLSIINIYFLLTFIFTSILSYYVFRRMNISQGVSMFGSLLYSFLPYHFMRGTAHLFLSAYYMIPITVLLIIELANESEFEVVTNQISIKDFFKKNTVIRAITFILVAISGIYYSFFACIFLLFIIARSIVISKKLTSVVVEGCTYVLTILITTIINISPTIINNYVNGKNGSTAVRSSIESEIYGLKISQLFLPIPNHIIPILSKIRIAYDSSTPLINENSMVSLGIIGSLGLVLILLYSFLVREKKNKYLEIIASLSLVSLLLGTIGGFGTIIAMILSPQIRAYNRISVYIAFFALTFLCILIDKSYKKIESTLYARRAFQLLLIVVTCFGILDQSGLSFRKDYGLILNEVTSDKQFVKEIETQLPDGAEVFQLPITKFPENGNVLNMPDYDQFKGYLFSDKLKWSYGGMKGRANDIWLDQIKGLSEDELVKTITIAGFRGIWINKKAYDQSSIDQLTANLNTIVGVEPIESDNNTLLFYNLSSYSDKLNSQYGEDYISKERTLMLDKPLLQWSQGFYSEENNNDMKWRWANKSAEIIIISPSKINRKVNLGMILTTGLPGLSNLQIDCGKLKNSIKINEKGTMINLPLELHPGINKVKFTYDGQPLLPATDPRVLYFRVDNFSMSEL